MRTREIMREARKDGRNAGKNAASWAFDGNTREETYRVTLKGIEDGDPAIYDAFNVPTLSGEWADDPTPSSLSEDYGIDEKRDPEGDLQAQMCDAWEDACGSAFWKEIERVCRFQLKGEVE